jgi:hypothetical protein
MRQLAFLICLGAGATALADTYTDTFEGGANPTGWHFLQGGDVLESTGGNPGYWLHQPQWDTFAPILRHSSTDSPFSGDYPAAGVTAISIDIQTLYTDFPIDGRPFAILLADTKGTDSPEDDDYVYYVNEEPGVPTPAEGWVHIDFAIPSDSETLPAGWVGAYYGDMENFRDGVTWSDVITSVDHVEFWWIHPAWFGIFQNWNVGADNISIVSGGAPCLGDIDGDGSVGQADLGVLLAAFGSCEGDPNYNPDADLDGDNCIGQTDLGTLLGVFGDTCE